MVRDALGLYLALFLFYGNSWDEATKTAHCFRDAKTRLNVPQALEYLIGVSSAEFRSDIWICRDSREMITHSRNISFSSAAQIEERAHFQPAADDPQKTRLTVTAKFGLLYLPFMQTLEDFALNSYFDGIGKARDYERPFIEAATKQPVASTNIEKVAKEAGPGEMGENPFGQNGMPSIFKANDAAAS